MCAAPGGKSFALAIDQKDRGEILSCDVHPHKLSLIERGAERLGIHSVRTALADGRERHAAWENAADLVVADVPCSGLGIIRKKPDIRFNASPEGIRELQKLQREILDTVCAYVKPGGKLLYSTCTLTKEENEDNREYILAKGGFTLLKERKFLPGAPSDGFYLTVFRKE